jgi:hypothetical protein
MERKVLKIEILDKIKTDPVLFGAVASALGVSPFTMPRIVKRNDEKLTQIVVLSVIKKHLGISKDSDLLEEMQEPEPKTAIA